MAHVLLEENKVCHAPQIDICPQAKTVSLVSQYVFLPGSEGWLKTLKWSRFCMWRGTDSNVRIEEKVPCFETEGVFRKFKNPFKASCFDCLPTTLKLVGNEAFCLPWLRETVKRFSAGIFFFFFEWHSGSTIACVYFGLFLVALAQHEDVWEPERSKSDAREMESHYNKLMAMVDLCWMDRGHER